MRFLVVGLGNPGVEYEDTRHNIGFSVLDHLAADRDLEYEVDRYVIRTEFRHKGRSIVLIKPQTYMNLSGNAVRYWLNKEKVTLDRLLVVTDDLALPYGSLRMRGKGGAGGHNGLQHIIDTMTSSAWARLRFGIGKEFRRGQQSDHVLGGWTSEEDLLRPELIKKAADGVLNFVSIGLSRTMNTFNA